MKKTLLLLLAVIAFISCNSNQVDYKYSQRKNIVSCDGVDNDLIKEVTYTFENFLMEHYDFKNQGNLETPLRNYLNNAEVGLYPMVERFDDHIIEFSKQLQKREDLWQRIGDVTYLNYNNELSKCITNSFKDEQFKNIFNALSSSKTLKHGNMAASIRLKLNDLSNDKAVLAYAAFDLFFAKIMQLDLNQSKEGIIKQVAAYNKAHVGHQH